MPDREQQLLDAAIEVLAEKGIRHLTHRGVDTRAGVAGGSTSNRFRTRDALVTGVLRRLLEREGAAWTQLALTRDMSSLEAFADALGRLVEELSGPLATLTKARHAVITQSELRPGLRTELENLRQQIAQWMAPLLVRLGSRDVTTDAAYLLAFLDGLLMSRLAEPAQRLDPRPALAALLRGLLGRP